MPRMALETKNLHSPTKPVVLINEVLLKSIAVADPCIFYCRYNYISSVCECMTAALIVIHGYTTYHKLCTCIKQTLVCLQSFYVIQLFNKHVTTSTFHDNV